MLKLIFLVTLMNLVIAKPSVPVEEEELPGNSVKDMEYLLKCFLIDILPDIAMEAEERERQGLSERQFGVCKEENEPCVTGWTPCCNTDQECQVCKSGSKWCIFGGKFCFPCSGTDRFLKSTCQPKATTTIGTTTTTVITTP